MCRDSKCACEEEVFVLFLDEVGYSCHPNYTVSEFPDRVKINVILPV